ncbi:MAG: DUF1624 domain-containing protein [Candidatus Bathyarchaeota archaeon]|nr:MAG: DUF1624 domain-containing protein [Candidatus Bathyarchaeota archaeon]
MQQVIAPVKQRGTGRIQFIDFARGVVMALMAWDHISGFWQKGIHHHGGEGVMGRAPEFLNTTWFLARFVSHWCAPTFIFLAGTVLALSTIKRLGRGESQRDITFRMIKRGGVLLLLEMFVVTAAFGGSPLYFGVIACIGICFMIFSVYRRLPPAAILLVSLIIVISHPFIDLSFIPTDNPIAWYLRVILHEPNHDWYPFTGLYPIFPWIGVMGLGWFFGTFLSELDVTRMKKLKSPLIVTGVLSIAAFFLVRWLNGFGNLLPRQGGTLMDWLYVSKYPPSLAFILWTLGGMCLFMAVGLHLEEWPGYDKGWTGVILTFGRNPLFFYLTHLWLYRVRPGWTPRTVFYLDLQTTILFWLVGLYILWRLCLRYEKFKRSHPDSLLQYI